MKSSTTTLAVCLALALLTVREVESKEREETTERNAPQVYTYTPPNQGSVYPHNVYPNSIYPNGVYPNNISPYNPSNPANNPAYNPSVTNSNYPGTVGGVYPYNGVGVAGQEAFTVRRASPYTTQGSKIIFTEPVTQVGSGWNIASSEFVAPSAGLYFFTFSAVSDRYNHFRITMKHNSRDVVSAFGDSSGYQMGSQSAILGLNAGDRVFLRLEEGRLHDVTSTRAYTTFSGFKIF
ncbi:complement C1q tumor necrosis factor-related protein 3-like [Penaeus indicus]|uniref:complement C1q tumor necrosis factor-related protein 3-like n=1 Tax=Penaeus indicus TaxID=29960 RepID=UPI00300CC794